MSEVIVSTPVCPGCGKTVIWRRRQPRSKLWCSPYCYRASRAGMGNKAKLLACLTERDRGRCGICRKLVRAVRGPMKPSIDHIVPRSKGGGNELSNLQLAHHRCNRSKGNRGGGEQLLLFG